MPLYKYECKDCNYGYTAQHTVDERYDERCGRCGGEVFIVIGRVGVNVFTPHFNVHLGEYVHSRQHQKTIMKMQGVESVGDASQEEIEKQAQYNKE
jgi:putative FmdB family regulatory protein